MGLAIPGVMVKLCLCFIIINAMILHQILTIFLNLSKKLILLDLDQYFIGKQESNRQNHHGRIQNNLHQTNKDNTEYKFQIFIIFFILNNKIND